MKDLLRDVERNGYDAETEKLVCLSMGNYEPKFYFAVDTATAEARLLLSHSSWSDDMDYNVANLLNQKDLGTLQTVEQLAAAAESAYLPGYTEKTIGEYADMATMVAGSHDCKIFMTGNQPDVLLTIERECSDFDIEKDRLMSFTVRKDDLNGANVVTYIFYIGVDRDNGEAAVFAAYVSEGKKSRTFYGDDVKQVADIFVEGANWAE